MLFEMLSLFHPRMFTVFRLWWCLVDGARKVAQSLGSTHGQVQTKGPVSLSVTVVKILEWVSGDVG